MPTQTEYLGASVTNFGPVTTVFTPAPSCSTAAFVTGLFTSANSTIYALGNEDCTFAWNMKACVPYGDKFDFVQSKAQHTPGHGFLPYMSPGLSCPSGWTTAGSMVGDGANGTSRTGIFTHSEILTNNLLRPPASMVIVGEVPAAEQYARLLVKGETMMACCPKGYDANLLGGCQSIIGPASEHGVSGICENLIPSGDIAVRTTIDGTTYDPPVEVLTDAAGAEFSPMTRSLAAAVITGYQFGQQAEMLVMIHQESDVKGSSGVGSSTANAGATSSSAAPAAASGSASASPTSASGKQAHIPIALGAVAALFMVNVLML